MAVLGAGGHATVVVDLLLLNDYEVVACIDENGGGPPEILGVPTRRTGASVPARARFLVAIGDNQVRLARHREFVRVERACPALIHPAATVARAVGIGAGSVVMAGAVVNAASHIGDAVIINTGATVDHHCYLADGVHVAPGAHVAGGVAVGVGATLGIGCTVLPGRCIGEGAVVAAGAVVIRDVESGAIVKGVPAK